MNKYIIIFMCMCSACRSNYCPQNKSNIDKFKTNLALVKAAEENNIEISVDDYRAALIFLSNVTGVVTKADYSSTVGYRSKEEYKQDVLQWEKWIGKNGCKLTTIYIDSVMMKVKQ